MNHRHIDERLTRFREAFVILAQAAKVGLAGFPGWNLMRQQAPSTTAANDVQDGFQDFSIRRSL